MARPRNINSDMSNPMLFAGEAYNPGARYMGPGNISPMIGLQPPAPEIYSGAGRGGYRRQTTSPAEAAAQAGELAKQRALVSSAYPNLQQTTQAGRTARLAVDAAFGGQGDGGMTQAEMFADLIGSIGGGSGGVGGSAAQIAYDPDPESTRSQALIDAISSGYGGMRQSEQDYLDALISQIGAQRTGAQQRAADAAAAADRTIAGLVSAAATSGQNVGQAYSQAQQQIADLVGQYAAEQAARQQGAQQTLGMFGAPAELAIPGGITPMDYLAATQGAMGRFGAAEQAYFAGAPTRYQALGSDYARQRQTALEQALAELDAQQAQREAEVARSLSQLGIQEQQAILGQQQAEWERQARYPREV